mgnify:CR=1 FL=1
MREDCVVDVVKVFGVASEIAHGAALLARVFEQSNLEKIESLGHVLPARRSYCSHLVCNNNVLFISCQYRLCHFILVGVIAVDALLVLYPQINKFLMR